MYLSRLEIENFRGIRSAVIEFSETTILIGENDSGKTTLLDAVCLVLSKRPVESPIYFEESDFYKSPGNGSGQTVGVIKVRLVFTERTPDEWSFLRNNELGIHLPDDQSSLQELSLDIRAERSSDGAISPATWRIGIEGKYQGGYGDDPAILSWIRRLNPVFRIKGAMMENMPESNEEIHARYREELRSLASVSHLFSQNGPPLEKVIYEILGRKPQDNGLQGKNFQVRRGSAAEKMGMLIFTTALLHSGSLMADPSSEPLVIIEDPEAHLHPMTLQAVKILIERLKWQKLVTTQSGDLLSDFPLQSICRIVRYQGVIRHFRVKPGALSREEIRRLSYHVRMRMSTATFARCWLLVEGESEIWLLPHLARLCGYDLSMEGIVCIEFAQCGISPLIKTADQLGIGWFLLADGDAAGKAYIETARHFARISNKNTDDHCLRFREKDIEHHLFFNGYADVYTEYAGVPPRHSQNMQPRHIIGRAIHRNSKPFMAVAVIEAISKQGSPGVPAELRRMIEKCVRLAKESVSGSQ